MECLWKKSVYDTEMYLNIVNYEEVFETFRFSSSHFTQQTDVCHLSCYLQKYIFCRALFERFCCFHLTEERIFQLVFATRNLPSIFQLKIAILDEDKLFADKKLSVSQQRFYYKTVAFFKL